MPNIRFNLPGEPEKLKQFARTFDHNVTLPSLEMRDNGELFGYVGFLQHPVVFPAFHPKFTTPRRLYHASEHIVASERMSSIDPTHPQGVAYVVLPMDISPDLPAHFGLKPSGQLYYG
jgi:hypothetical protein